MTASYKTNAIAWVILVLLAGCGGPRPEVVLTATQVLPTATPPPPTGTWSPTDTPLSPTVTPELAPPKTSGPLTTAADYVQGARMFDEQQALRHIEYLAGDELAGRSPGTPGSRAAGDYITARMAEYGLQPAGLDSTYFQTFTESITRVAELPVLAVTSFRWSDPHRHL